MAEVVAKGRAAERAVAEELAAEGVKVLGEHVTARTEEGVRVIDKLVGTMEMPGPIEVKSAKAQRTLAQRVKGESMATRGAVLVGKNAPWELRNRKIPIPTEVRRPKKRYQPFDHD